MIPYIYIFNSKISSFCLMAVISAAAFLGVLHIELKKTRNGDNEELFILPKIVFSGIVALLFSAILDALVKIPENKGFVLSGITFYGGLIGVIISLYAQLRYAKRNTEYSIEKWFNIITVPLIIFHIFGRIGCFLAGCCYGKATASIWGVQFPDNIEAGILHNGLRCYPTQLFEVTALTVILLVVMFQKHKFEVYILLYAVSRFVIEFFRGDNRGVMIFNAVSPAQFISVVFAGLILIKFIKKRNTVDEKIFNGVFIRNLNQHRKIQLDKDI